MTASIILFTLVRDSDVEEETLGISDREWGTGSAVVAEEHQDRRQDENVSFAVQQQRNIKAIGH